MLVGSATGSDDRSPVAFPGGAALAGEDGLWVLADTDAGRALGPALAVARQGSPDAPLHLLVDADEGLLARRASQFLPPPTVWRIAGTRLREADADPIPEASPLDPRVAPFADVLEAAGADPIVEHGRLVGEVRGLEVARVVVDDDGPRLEVGVGRFDREAHALLHAAEPTEETLRQVVELVSTYRSADAPHHPLKHLARSRWLRWRLLQEPALVGAAYLAPMAPTVEPPDLRTPWPAPATGVDDAGEPLVVVCSTGVDLDLVPAAADARLMDGRGARLVLAVLPDDDHPVTRGLNDLLAEPGSIVRVGTLGL